MVTTFTDSDWAGDRSSRKSTSGGVVCLGHHVIKSWSSMQQLVALSSGEAELYVPIKGASQTKGIISMLVDFGSDIRWYSLHICINGNGNLISKGLGRTRHLDVQYHWILEEVAEGCLKVHKVATKENPADILTNCGEGRHAEAQALDIELGNTRAVTARELDGFQFL